MYQYHDLITALFLLACTAYYAVTVYPYVHMLQLNSYIGKRYGGWCADNVERLLSMRALMPLLLTPLAVILHLDEEERELIAVGWLLVCGWVNRPAKAKKPLVVTARVKRLFAALGLLALLFVYFYLRLHTMKGMLLYGVLLSVPWLAVRLVGEGMAQIEKTIAKRYIRQARQLLASMPELIVVGVTGSFGKTSVKTFLRTLLSVRYNTLATPESYNTTLGVVRTVNEQLMPHHRIFIVEMGARQRGDIAEICDIVRPRYGVLTAIGAQHLETFGDIAAVADTKLELCAALPEDGIAFLNTGSAAVAENAGRVTVKTVTYNGESADFTAGNVRTDVHGTAFTVRAPGGVSCDFETELLGEHAVANLLGCIAVAVTLGIDIRELVQPVRMLAAVPHRLQLLPGGIIDDAYNSNPEGFRAALDVLAGFDCRRVLVTPGMVELGDREEEINRELGRYAAKCCDIAVLVGEKQAPPLRAGLLDAGFPEEQIAVVADLQAGLAYVKSLPESRQIVLLENDLPDNYL